MSKVVHEKYHQKLDAEGFPSMDIVSLYKRELIYHFE